jgi:hypothetical protein
LGVWAANRSFAARAQIKSWKRTHPLDPDALAEFAAALVSLVRAWSLVIPSGTVVTCPPQGASLGLPYAAEALGRCVSLNLGLPYTEVLARTEPKTCHGPHAALRQQPFVCTLPDPVPTMIVVVDDLITSGRSMGLSIEAIQAAGVAAFGFGYSGC